MKVSALTNDLIDFETIFNDGSNITEFPISEYQDSSISEYQDSPFISMSNPIVQEQVKTLKATKIIRTHYSRKIYDLFEWLSINFESTIEALPKWQELLLILFEFKDEHYEDPFSSFISGLYDGLTNNDSWINLNNEDFKCITKLIKSLNNNSKLDYDKIDKALMELEDIGLDTTPFG